MSQPLIVVVTGANRGIGQGISKLLAETQHRRPLCIYATSRSGIDLGIQALSPNEIRYSKLDISDISSVITFITSTLREDGKIDVLINNAGVNNNSKETPELAEQTIDLNYHGTKNMCQLFLTEGKMRTTPDSRIVNVSSTASSLSNYEPSIQSRFRSAQSISDIDALAQEYVSARKSQNQEAVGFGAPSNSYQVSKALVNALTVVLSGENESVAVNCCCPGWVDSDMGNLIGKPPKTLEEGARIPVRLAIGDLGENGNENGGLETGNGEILSGRYYGNDRVMDTGWGRAREW